MIEITEITDEPRQKLDITLENNEVITLQLEFSTQQQGWFASFAYGEFAINSFRLTTAANILRQYRELLPFGIAISTPDQSEPIFIDDFSTQRINFFVLNQEEVEDVENTFYSNV